MKKTPALLIFIGFCCAFISIALLFTLDYPYKHIAAFLFLFFSPLFLIFSFILHQKSSSFAGFSKDSLTGVFSRTYFFDKMTKLINLQTPFTLLYIDLNKFKIINDIHGHQMGDVVLKTIGNRMQILSNNTLLFFRFGGDEFIVITHETNNVKVQDISKKIADIIKKPILLNTFEYEVTASIGAARFPENGGDINQLLSLADTAMYQSKKNKKNSFALTSSQDVKALQRKIFLEKRLKKINTNTELGFTLQPIIAIKTGKTKSFKALLHWKYDNNNSTLSSEFIPIAEGNGTISKITHWLFTNGLHQIKEWNERYNANYKIHLQVSQNCIHNRIFFSTLEHMLKTFNTNPEWLVIELSEYSLIHSPQYMMPLLHSIRNLGAQIALNNFGTDACSLKTFTTFDIDYIKLDRKVINDIDNNSNSAFFAQTTINIAHNKGIIAIAEGVDRQEQFDYLQSVDCDLMQGTVCGNPLSPKKDHRNLFQHKTIITL